MTSRLFLLQRLTAAIMAPLVLGHVALILYATGEGLSAEAILGRTRGSAFWGAYYTLFAVAASVHAPIGLRTVIREWTPWRARSLDGAMILLGAALLVLGMRAVIAVAV